MAKKGMKKALCILTAAMLLAVLAPLSAARALPVLYAPEDGPDLLRYGNLNIAIPADDLLAEFSPGDIVTVDVEGFGSRDVPLCANYDDVSPGEPLLRAVAGKDRVTLAINYGQIAVDMQIAEAAPADSPYAYRVREDVRLPIAVTVTLKEAGGYADRLSLGALTRTDDITDYPGLTEAEFANFRMIRTTGIAEGVLYRSSSPVNPEIGRNAFADRAAEEAGVRTVINTSESRAVAEAFTGYADTYCSRQTTLFLNLPVGFISDQFRDGFSGVFTAIAEEEGPWLIHCVEGKDRTGLAAAVLEALMGASVQEIQEDYLLTYLNFYDVRDGVQQPLSEEVRDTIRSVIVNNLSLLFGTEVTEESDLAALAENYLREIGVTDAQIGAIREKLTDG